MSEPDETDPLCRKVREHRCQRERCAREAPGLLRQLAGVGVLGWLVVAPILAGIALGRWLDQRLGSGVFWTGGLLVLGAVLGGWLAWRRIQQE